MPDPAPTPGAWQRATVVALRDETARARTIRLALDAPADHLAGQHYVVRLTAPDGYTASRSYSVASAPDGSNEIELTVERLEDGEVSSSSPADAAICCRRRASSRSRWRAARNRW